jgi:hypothetical protein
MANTDAVQSVSDNRRHLAYHEPTNLRTETPGHSRMSGMGQGLGGLSPPRKDRTKLRGYGCGFEPRDQYG